MIKSNTSEFIRKARLIHGCDYDYSQSIYKTAILKLQIRCIKHDLIFNQSPNGHLSGKGCPKCRYEKVRDKKNHTYEDFVLKANIKHDYRYDYSESIYTKAKTKIKITCPVHGVFNQTPETHLRCKGCPKCSSIKAGEKASITPEIFKQKTDSIFNGKYTCLSEFENLNSIMDIRCDKHGVFKKKAHYYFRGSGCNLCAIENTIRKTSLTLDEFIRRSRLVHKDKYSYSKVVYKNSNSKVDIVCDIHGIFKQNPSKHMIGHGCIRCRFNENTERNRNNPIGWATTAWKEAAEKSKNFDSFKVYVIRCWNDNEEFYKIGRTFCKVERRFNTKQCMPYNYEVVNLLIFEDSRSAHNKENELKKINKKSRYMPKISFGGMYECFTYIEPIE